MSTIIGLVSTFRLPLHWRGGLDVGQEKKQAEVQNAEEEEQDWTLNKLESRQRSKMQRKKSKIGHWTG